MKRMFSGLAVAFALFFLLTQPQSAADLVRGAGGVLNDAFTALTTFVSALFR